MKSNRWPIILISILGGLCLCCLVAGGVGYVVLRDLPPNPLSDSGYYVGVTKVYYFPGFGIAESFEIPGADPRSFKILDETYALDSARVYRDGQPIPNADPTTFEIVSFRYTRDANYVYLNSDIFSDDPANFEVLGDSFVRDSRHIYWGGKIVSDDPSHLAIIGEFDYHFYFKDSQNAFVNGAPIQGADPATFEVIAAGYSRDGSQIFNFDQPIPNADLATFEVIESPYARDAHSAYWRGIAIPTADPNTFRVLNAAFECSADSANAYYQDKVIQGVDASTIPLDAKANSCSDTELYLAP